MKTILSLILFTVITNSVTAQIKRESAKKKNIPVTVQKQIPVVKTTGSASNNSTRTNEYSKSANRLYNNTYTVNLRDVNGKNIKVNLKAENIFTTNI